LLRYFKLITSLNNKIDYQKKKFKESEDEMLFKISKKDHELVIKLIMVNLNCMFQIRSIGTSLKKDLIEINNTMVAIVTNLQFANPDWNLK
jgi:hypothetical protein